MYLKSYRLFWWNKY